MPAKRRSEAQRIRSTYRWQRLRSAVLARDAGICRECGHPGATTVDHIVPLARGGEPFDPRNLAACHDRCNKRKGTRVGPPVDPTSERW